MTSMSEGVTLSSLDVMTNELASVALSVDAREPWQRRCLVISVLMCVSIKHNFKFCHNGELSAAMPVRDDSASARGSARSHLMSAQLG